MVKIKIYEGGKERKGRVCKIIEWLTHNRNSFLEKGIDIHHNHETYDYILLPWRYIDIRHADSIEDSRKTSYEVIKNLNNIIITDDNDNPSLYGYKHLLSNDKISFVFKSYMLDREDYKTPTVFGGIKHYIDKNHPSYVGYEFTDYEWDKLKLCGVDIGFEPHFWNQLERFDSTPQNYSNKNIDVFAIFQGVHPGRTYYNQEMGLYYTQHRTKCWEEVNKSRYMAATGFLPWSISNSLQKLSKVTVSPYGMGEFCYRDYEAIFNLSVIIKPDVSHVKTLIDYFEPYVNYIPCKNDYSDIKEKINLVISDENLRANLVESAYNQFYLKYKKETVVNHLTKILLK
jgi:hypothetical protein